MIYEVKRCSDPRFCEVFLVGSILLRKYKIELLHYLELLNACCIRLRLCLPETPPEFVHQIFADHVLVVTREDLLYQVRDGLLLVGGHHSIGK